MQYPRIVAGPDGRASFEEYARETVTREYVPGHPVEMIELGTCGMVIQRMPPGTFQPWHVSPRPHLAITLAGEVEITVGAGQGRRFRPGQYFVGMDLEGQGHETRVIGNTDWIVAVVALDE
ncbi:MAG: hypothetical protein IT305_04780 [Chloroflexi bacterium]|nr:hypothetical protein [Chloroflexota bacterium]